MSDPLRSSATISDVEWVRAIAELREPMRNWGYYGVMVWDLAERLNIHPNRVRSKARRAAKRGLSDGCTCGCRGDFKLLPAGEALLASTSSEGRDS